MLLLLTLKVIDPACQVFVSCRHFSKFDKGADEKDVHLHCLLASEYRRKHGDSLLSECIRICSPQFAQLEITNCDLKFLNSVLLNWNIKSFGKRLILHSSFASLRLCAFAIKPLGIS